MCVHIIVKNPETGFVVAEAKASVNERGILTPEADTVVAEQEFILFMAPYGILYHFDTPQGLEHHQVAELFAYAGKICQERGIHLTRSPRPLRQEEPEIVVHPPVPPLKLLAKACYIRGPYLN